MFEISQGMITLYIKTYPGFEYEYVEDLQADLLQCLNMAQLMEAFHFTAEQIKKSHPMIERNNDDEL